MAIQKTRNPSLTPGRVLLCLCISLFIALLLGVLPRIRFVGDLLRDVEMSTRDIRMRLRPPVSDKSGMIVVGLTDLEHTLYGSGIQSREVYQYLLQDLKRLDARAVLFDILFERSLPLDEALALKMGEIPTFISYKFLTQDLFVD
ncbi:MAG TPA: CHASE2 domain-containing protein, partial [Candidatus Sumerlaeota bacterium]|nr:CHASE2 domain-containing protein [Candidatus Sumerlaeota bacterium]